MEGGEQRQDSVRAGIDACVEALPALDGAPDLFRRSFEASNAERFRLHFLPPYSPNDNKIEMVWKDLHANVTRTHRCTSIEQLTREARAYLRRRQRARAWVAWFARPTRRTRKAA